METRGKIWILVTLYCTVTVVQPARLLFVPFMAKSHIMEQCVIAEELVHRGHEVFMLLGHTYPMLESVKKLGVRPILFEAADSMFYSEHVENEMMKGFMSEQPAGVAPRGGDTVMQTAYRACNSTLENSDLLDKLKVMKFALTVVDALPHAACNFLLPQILSLPYVSMSGIPVPLSVGVPGFPSFEPFFMMPLTDKMSLSQRISNLVTHLMLFWYQPTKLFGETSEHGTVTHMLESYGVSHWKELVTKSELFIETILSPLLWGCLD